MNSSIAQRIKTPVSAIGVSLAILLMIAALTLILTPVLPHIFSDAPHTKPTPANKTAIATEERAIMTTSPSPTTQVALAAPTVLAKHAAQAQDIPAGPTTSPQPQTPPRETAKPSPAPNTPITQVKLNGQDVSINVKGTGVTVDHTTLQPITTVITTVTNETGKILAKL